MQFHVQTILRNTPRGIHLGGKRKISHFYPKINSYHTLFWTEKTREGETKMYDWVNYEDQYRKEGENIKTKYEKF